VLGGKSSSKMTGVAVAAGQSKLGILPVANRRLLTLMTYP
jgi:hypothetical protein